MGKFSLLVLVCAGSAAGVSIDNGVTGDGRLVANITNGGQISALQLDPAGVLTLQNILYGSYISLNGTSLQNTTITSVAALAGGGVSSSGTFAGPNGSITWTVLATLTAGSQVLGLTVNLSSTSAFGAVRLVHYVDQDVLGSSNNLIVIPTTGGTELLTVATGQQVGLGHAADGAGATGATYDGWAAGRYSALQTAVGNNSQGFSPAGVINGLAGISDSRYPGLTAYGTADIESAHSFTLTPAGTSASATFYLGGSPSGAPTGNATVPEPSTYLLLCSALAVLSWRTGGLKNRAPRSPPMRRP